MEYEKILKFLKLNLPFSGKIRNVLCQLLADVSGHPVGPTFKGQKFKRNESLTPEGGTDRLSRNVGKFCCFADRASQSSLNLCTGRPPTGVMIPDAV